MEKDYLRVNVAAVSTNQHALDFTENKRRIFRSIEMCKSIGVAYRAGGELEVSGYSCDDHFKELDTIYHCWEVVNDLLQTDLTENIIVEMNMPVIHKSVCYNSKVLLLNRRVVFIRPKAENADEGNYRESRYFVPYVPYEKGKLDEFMLPHIIESQTGQRTCPFGLGIVQCLDSAFGLSFSRISLKAGQGRLAYLNNADFVVGSTAVHFTAGYKKRNIETIQSETFKNGGAYIFANLLGCDGNNTYFTGGNNIIQNGNVLSTGKYHTLNEIEITQGVLNLQKIRLQRQRFTGGQRMMLEQEILPVIHLEHHLCTPGIKYSKPFEPVFDSNQQQYAEVASSYLWDYLRKSNAGGFFLPVDGGLNSSATTLVIYYLCLKIYREVNLRNADVLKSLRKIIREPEYMPTSAEEICGKLLKTAYIGTEAKGSPTRQSSLGLGAKTGASHLDTDFSGIFEAFTSWMKENLPKMPRSKAEGGTNQEDAVFTNLKGRLRMTLSYLLAQLIPTQGGNKTGFLLMIGNYNVDESLLGFTTKYDTSSGDVNPLGTLNTSEIIRITEWFRSNLKWNEIEDVIQSHSQFVPPVNGHEDEDKDLQLTWQQVEVLNKFRNERLCGPFSMFDNLNEFWPEIDLDLLHDTVKKFFTIYANNRHKTVIQTPALYMSNHSCDANKYDYRPYLYNGFEYQFHKMDKLKEQIQMSNVTKQHKSMNLRHAFVGQIDGGGSKLNKSSGGASILTGDDVLREHHVPGPFEFTNNNQKAGDGKTHTPEPEPNFS